MSEATIGEQPAITSGRKREIVHFPNTDMVINWDAEKAPSAHKLADILKDGIPDGWEDIGLTPQDLEEMEDDPDDSRILRPKSGSAKGTVDGVTFMLKPKYNADGLHVRKEIARASHGKDIQMGIRVAQLMNSVLSEIVLSPKIKEIASSPAAQAMAHKYGFKGIRYLEPVLAIINRKTGEKGLVYEYIDGAVNLGELFGNDPSKYGSYWGLGKEFDELLWANGIDSNENGGAQQFIVDREGNLYHIDAETYSIVR